ncbi:MAG: hypothetical protein Q7S84_04270 [bacterium]|nr:hypothetical protein [bacterium]
MRHSSKIFWLALPALLLVASQVEARAGFLGASSTEDFISKLYTYSIGLGGLLAVGAIVTGGILIATSGVVNKQQLGRDLIAGALWGLALLLGAYFLLKTVNPQLVKLKVPGITLCTGTQTPERDGCLKACVPRENKIPGVECYPTAATTTPPI